MKTETIETTKNTFNIYKAENSQLVAFPLFTVEKIEGRFHTNQTKKGLAGFETLEICVSETIKELN